MSQPGIGRTKGTAPRTSLLDVIKVVLRLGPKQINDEIQLAIAQMKTKGVAAGIAVALMVVGVVFLTFLVVALIVAAVAALSLIFELWAAALIVAGVFLVIALIFALIGLLKLKKTFPLLPEDAIRGFRLDLGVAREGTRFDPQSLDQADSEKRRQKEESKRQAAEQAKKDAKTPGAGPRHLPPTASCCAAPVYAATTWPRCRTRSPPAPATSPRVPRVGRRASRTRPRTSVQRSAAATSPRPPRPTPRRRPAAAASPRQPGPTPRRRPAAPPVHR
ncbi:phage holin family protein [Nesterenkonia sp. AN1]|uniref:phage holin family protein n=1 Tax=Nesterenkonia sp. AN1 TaxID=652017 RepID=UPI0009FDBA58|nr:phage holin family protein [Nesterenkonia sp. AN1]